MLLTRPPLPLLTVRLACVKHAASVRSEPGSNSQVHPVLKLLLALKQNENPIQNGVIMRVPKQISTRSLRSVL